MFKNAFPGVRRFFKDDFHRKAIAVFFGCLIWFFVNRHISEVETFKNVKVVIFYFLNAE